MAHTWHDKNRGDNYLLRNGTKILRNGNATGRNDNSDTGHEKSDGSNSGTCADGGRYCYANVPKDHAA